MKGKLSIAILLALCAILLARLDARGQDDADIDYDVYPDLDLYDIEAQLNGYMYDLDLIAVEIPIAGKSRLQSLSGACQRLDAKKALYVQTNQDAISSDESLMDLIGQYQERFALITDSIQRQIDRCDQLVEFGAIERTLCCQDTTYASLLQKAQLFSLTDKTAQQLAAVKKEESTMRQSLDAQYAQAVEISAANPFLKSRMQSITEAYNNMALLSDQVQAAEYKSLFDRIKDYLFGLAAVALILMFVNMISTKIKTAKQMRDQAKQLKEQLRIQNDDYPRI